jgi:Arylsulfatase A and related enzymes
MRRTMSRRDFLSTVGAAAPLVAAPPEKRPNFVFIFTDDQRFDTIRALGNREVHTPNMDRLVKQGLAFTHVFTMGGTIPAICAPSRAQLMTGQTLFHVHRSIIQPGDAAGSRRPFTLFPEALHQAGCATFATGKWHNGPALFNRAFRDGAAIFFGGMSDHDKVRVFDYDPSGRYLKENARTGNAFSSELFTNAALQFLKNRKKDKPFLLYIAYTSPHDPRMAPQRYRDLYQARNIRLPANYLPQHPFDNGEMKVRDELLAPFPRTPEEVQEHIASYYAMISEVDAQIGRVLDEVERSGEAGNTYIIFASDNGLAVRRHGLLGKQNLYDHSVRVPMVIAGPGIPKGRRSHALCHLMDLCPTICDLARVPIPDTVEARSLKPQLNNPNAPGRDAVIFAYRHFQRGVRTDRYKLILYNVKGVKTAQLFDLQKDPDERHNLAGDPGQAARIRELKALLQQRLREAGDRTDLDASDWTV